MKKILFLALVFLASVGFVGAQCFLPNPIHGRVSLMGQNQSGINLQLCRHGTSPNPTGSDCMSEDTNKFGDYVFDLANMPGNCPNPGELMDLILTTCDENDACIRTFETPSVGLKMDIAVLDEGVVQEVLSEQMGTDDDTEGTDVPEALSTKDIVEIIREVQKGNQPPNVNVIIHTNTTPVTVRMYGEEVGAGEISAWRKWYSWFGAFVALVVFWLGIDRVRGSKMWKTFIGKAKAGKYKKKK